MKSDRGGASPALQCVETIRIVAVLLRPVTPSLSLRIFLQLGLSPEEAAGVTWEDAAWGGIRAGEAFPKPEPVFKRMEGDLVTVAAEAGVAAGAAK